MTCPSEVDTVLIDISRWNPPVQSPSDLETDAREGRLCFVVAVDLTYLRRDGQWLPVGPDTQLDLE